VKQLGGARECMVLGVRAGDWCFVPFWDEHDGYRRPALLFKSLADTRTLLRKTWGAPVVNGDDWFWFDPDARPPLRARLRGANDPAQLDFEEYLPLQTFLGPGKALAFETTPLLGEKKEAVQKAYATRQQVWESTSGSIFFPPAEVGGDLQVQLDVEGGIVTKVVVDLPVIDDPSRKELVLGMLEKKWGKRQRVEGEQNEWRFPLRPDVLVYRLGRDLTIRITPAR
jgi:hypothetical protein